MKRRRSLQLQRTRASARLRAAGTGAIACAVAMGLPWYLYLRLPWSREEAGIGGLLPRCPQDALNVPQNPCSPGPS